MDLTTEEARELFPRDRGDDVDDAELTEWMYIADDGEITVTIDSTTWTVAESDRDAVLDELADSVERDDVTLWDLLRDRDVTTDILDRNA